MDLLPKTTRMREQGEKNWNGEIAFSKAKGGDLPMGFFDNDENADKPSGAVEDPAMQ